MVIGPHAARSAVRFFPQNTALIILVRVARDLLCLFLHTVYIFVDETFRKTRTAGVINLMILGLLLVANSVCPIDSGRFTRRRLQRRQKGTGFQRLFTVAPDLRGGWTPCIGTGHCTTQSGDDGCIVSSG
jgi:hypothetical protein